MNKLGKATGTKEKMDFGAGSDDWQGVGLKPSDLDSFGRVKAKGNYLYIPIRQAAQDYRDNYDRIFGIRGVVIDSANEELLKMKPKE